MFIILYVVGQYYLASIPVFDCIFFCLFLTLPWNCIHWLFGVRTPTGANTFRLVTHEVSSELECLLKSVPTSCQLWVVGWNIVDHII